MPYQPSNKVWGEKLRELRLHTVDQQGRGRFYLTQGRLAQEISKRLPENRTLDDSTISTWEKGLKQPDVTDRELLCAIVKVLKRYHAIQNMSTADDWLLSGGYGALQPDEAYDIFSAIAVGPQRVYPTQNANQDKSDIERFLNYQIYRFAGKGIRYSESVISSASALEMFLDPPWTEYEKRSISAAQQESLQQTVSRLMLLDRGSNRERLLILGEPGQGKTVFMMRLLVNFTHMHLSNSTLPIPLFIPLRDIGNSDSNTFGTLASVWEYLNLSGQFPYNYQRFMDLNEQRMFVFLLDGFDEIKGTVSQSRINSRVCSEILTQTSIITCRTQFYEYFLSRTDFASFYNYQFLLLPWGSIWVTYVEKFCDLRNLNASEIVMYIQRSRELSDISTRPLLLAMIMDLHEELMSESEWTIVKVYRRFTAKWLEIEAAKPDSILTWHDKDRFIENIGWQVFYDPFDQQENEPSIYEITSFSQRDLRTAISSLWGREYKHIPLALIIEDICNRTLFIGRESDALYFVHKSFQEFYAALFMCTALSTSSKKAAYVLERTVPYEIGNLVKKMMISEGETPSKIRKICRNLIAAYKSKIGLDRLSSTVRQHAGHLLGQIEIPLAQAFIEEVIETEPDLWVRRGLMLGLVLGHKRADVMDRYIQLISTNLNAGLIAMGYSLVYYGDQSPSEGYDDKGGEKCEGVLNSIFRRLKNSSEKDVLMWPLSLWELATLIETRGLKILYSRNDEIDLLRIFLNTLPDHPTKSFSVQFERVKQLVGSLIET